MITNSNLFFMLVLASVFCAVPLDETAADDWLHWRGPQANGVAAADAKPPVEWGAEKNIAWKADLPGKGTSTPIVVGNRIFVLTAIPTEKEALSPPSQDSRNKTETPSAFYQFVVLCFDLEKGTELWRNIAIEAVPHEGIHPSHSYAGSSPTSDGKHLFVSFGSRGIFCYTLDGKKVWGTDLGDMHTRYGWGESVTPVVCDERLIVNWDQEEGSFIACLDKNRGSEIWRTARPDEVTSWNTPFVTNFDGRTQVIVNGTHKVRSYDIDDGSEIWTCAGQTVNAIPSIIRFEDAAIAMSGYRGSIAYSVPLNSTGNVKQNQLNWSHKKGTPYVPSASLSGNRLYFTSTLRNVLTVLDAKSGEPMCEPMRLPEIRSIYASPMIADGRVYIVGRGGACVVLSDEATPKVIAVNQLEDSIDSSPVAVGESLLLRSHSRLYCIRK